MFDFRHHLDVVVDRFTPESLQEWVSVRLNQPLPMYRPRWKFWLAPNAEGGAVLLLRIHHCYADGLSLLGIFDRLCPPSPSSIRPSTAHPRPRSCHAGPLRQRSGSVS